MRSIAPGSQRVVSHPTLVDCFWQTLDTPDGETLLHLSTFGSDSRQSKPKSSQSLQLDRTQAEQLLGVLSAAFPGLVAQTDSEEEAAPTREPQPDDDAHAPRDENLVKALEASATFAAQWTVAGRIPLSPAEVAAFIGTLAAAPGARLPLQSVAAAMGVRPTRLQGALATLEKVMNVEGYPVLEAVDAHLRLDVSLLREQFALNAVESTGLRARNS
ncbi:hypothetical protein [Sinomonas sp. B1-1]|uniref:hypothetical protein n=1 Tax=Sinomonas sp. B1-1 TaxID=3141454 RepID=UPI003D2C6406